jgi:hypothetical protein
LQRLVSIIFRTWLIPCGEPIVDGFQGSQRHPQGESDEGVLNPIGIYHLTSDTHIEPCKPNQLDPMGAWSGVLNQAKESHMNSKAQRDGRTIPESPAGKYFHVYSTRIHAHVVTDTSPLGFMSASHTLEMFDTRVPTKAIEDGCFPSDQRSIERDGRYFCQLRRSVIGWGDIRWGPEQSTCGISFTSRDSLRRHYHSRHMGCPRKTVKKPDQNDQKTNHIDGRIEGDFGGKKKRRLRELSRKYSRSKFISDIDIYIR